MATKKYIIRSIRNKENENGVLEVHATKKKGVIQTLFGSDTMPEVFHIVKGEAMSQYALKAKESNSPWTVNLDCFIKAQIQGSVIYRDKRIKNSYESTLTITTPQPKQSTEKTKIPIMMASSVDANSTTSESGTTVVNTKQEIIKATENIIAKNKDVRVETGAVLSSRLEDFLSYSPPSMSFRNTKVELYNLHSIYIECSNNELRWNLTIDIYGFSYKIFDIDNLGESRFRKGTVGLIPTEEYNADNICKFYYALTGLTVKQKKKSYKSKQKNTPETIVQYNKVKDLCKDININYTSNMSIKELVVQKLMRFQTLDTIMELIYENSKDPQIASLCKEVGIKWEGEPSEAFFIQFWGKTNTCDQIDKEINVLCELLQK